MAFQAIRRNQRSYRFRDTLRFSSLNNTDCPQPPPSIPSDCTNSQLPPIPTLYHLARKQKNTTNILNYNKRQIYKSINITNSTSHFYLY
jgi:hypothetical protein